MDKQASIESFFNKQSFSQEGLLVLRKLLLSIGLEERLKWGAPVYTFEGKNIVGIGSFKSYFGLWYFQGALLEDKHNLLINAQEGKTSAFRQIRFQNKEEIDPKIIRSYTLEAIKNQKAGKEIKANLNRPIHIPLELKKLMAENKELKTAFKNLTKGKQREYCDHIAEAKREDTRLRRLEKCVPIILKGAGLHDKYKK